MVGQKIGVLLWWFGVSGPIAANEIQKTDLIPGFTEHAEAYALMASIGVGVFGGFVMLTIGILNWREQRRSNLQDEKETERHNRANEAKDT